MIVIEVNKISINEMIALIEPTKHPYLQGLQSVLQGGLVVPPPLPAFLGGLVVFPAMFQVLLDVLDGAGDVVVIVTAEVALPFPSFPAVRVPHVVQEHLVVDVAFSGDDFTDELLERAVLVHPRVPLGAEEVRPVRLPGPFVPLHRRRRFGHLPL